MTFDDHRGSRPRAVRRAIALALVCLPIGACAVQGSVPGADSSGPAATAIDVDASDQDCKLSSTDAKVGPNTFVVTNNGTKPTEFYVYGEGYRVEGATVNIPPGLQRKLFVQLSRPGMYHTACRPGLIGAELRSELTVTREPNQTDPAGNFESAADSYWRYLLAQTDALLSSTVGLVGAIKKGDVVGATALYPVAHTFYERTKPIAGRLPNDLDRRIDLREVDRAPGAPWTGFRRLEKDIWDTGLQPDTNAIADRLLADVKELRDAMHSPAWSMEPTELARAAADALNGLATDIPGGMDEPYSHTDLWDFQAIVDGAQAAVSSVRATLDERNPDLGRQVDNQFVAMQDALAKNHDGDGFVFYDKVPDAGRQILARAAADSADRVAQAQLAVAN